MTTSVYLDQNKWIDLARAYTAERAGGAPAKYAAAYAACTAHAERGSAVFPLSAIHYMETARIRDPHRRARLGRAMLALSQGHTIASARAIVEHEIETALAARFPAVTPSPFQLVGRGMSHAFGRHVHTFRLPAAARDRLDPAQCDAIEAYGQAVLEAAAVTGEGPDGEDVNAPPLPDLTRFNTAFMQHLRDIPRVKELPRAQWDDMLYAICLADVAEPLGRILLRHHLSIEVLGTLGRVAMRQFVDDLPSRHVELHLHRQVLRNPALTPKPTDLEDWAGLGLAVQHCDVVVCEKHFASMLRRDGFRPRATVLTDVDALLDVLPRG